MLESVSQQIYKSVTCWEVKVKRFTMLEKWYWTNLWKGYMLGSGSQQYYDIGT